MLPYTCNTFAFQFVIHVMSCQEFRWCAENNTSDSGVTFFASEQKTTGDCGLWHSHNSYYLIHLVKVFLVSKYLIFYYKLARICNAIASQIVINYYKLERICNAFPSQFVIKYYILDDTQSTLENKGERSLPLSSRYRVNVGFDILIIHIIKLT